MPLQARKILRGLRLAPPVTIEAADSAARLYQISLVAGRRFPSVRIAYQIAAVDSIAQAMGQRGFKQFAMEKIGESREVKEFVDNLWSRFRSAHFHAGKFPFGEFQFARSEWGNIEAMARTREQLHVHQFGHRCVGGLRPRLLTP